MRACARVWLVQHYRDDEALTPVEVDTVRSIATMFRNRRPASAGINGTLGRNMQTADQYQLEKPRRPNYPLSLSCQRHTLIRN